MYRQLSGTVLQTPFLIKGGYPHFRCILCSWNSYFKVSFIWGFTSLHASALSLTSGEGKCFDRRALLLYDGIHYDPLVIMDSGGVILQTTFPVSNESVMFEAADIARQAHQVYIIYSHALIYS